MVQNCGQFGETGPDAAEAFNRHHVPSQSPLLLLLPSCNSTQNCPARLHNTEQKPGSEIRRRRSSRCRQQSHYPKATPMILFTLALPTCQTIRRPLIWSSLMFYRRAPSCKSIGKGVIFRIDPDEEQRRNAGLRLYTFWIEPTRLFSW